MPHPRTAQAAVCLFATASIVTSFVTGCTPKAAPSTEKPAPVSKPSTGDKGSSAEQPIDPKTLGGIDRAIKPIAGRKPNPDGGIPIFMYHHVGTKEDPVFVTPKQFLGDLTRLEKLGFRPITLEEFLAGCPHVPAGVSPVVMTFDDSNRDQIRLLDDGSIDPTCFLGLWLSFTKAHPDFPPVATYFILPEVFFGQPKMFDQKMKIVRDLGCELANHTVAHRMLSKKSDAHVMWEIAAADTWLSQHGEHKDAPLALPYGVYPKNMALLAGFTYQDKLFQGKHFAPRAVLRIVGGAAPLPGSPKFDKLHVPRIPSGTGPGTIDRWLTDVEQGKIHPYVAGG